MVHCCQHMQVVAVFRSASSPVLTPCIRRCCAVLCCAVLCCAVLCCAVLCCAVLCLLGCVLQPLIQAGVQLVVANFPHNPTGTMLPQQEWQQLVSACEAAGAWLFSDEMYKFSGALPLLCVLLFINLCILFHTVMHVRWLPYAVNGGRGGGGGYRGWQTPTHSAIRHTQLPARGRASAVRYAQHPYPRGCPTPGPGEHVG
jgi:hypothetical protein